MLGLTGKDLIIRKTLCFQRAEKIALGVIRSPDKDPGSRLTCIRVAGELGIPFTSGILIGIGRRVGRLDSLLKVAASRRNFVTWRKLLFTTLYPSPAQKCTQRHRRRSRGLVDSFSSQTSMQVRPNLNRDASTCCLPRASMIGRRVADDTRSCKIPNSRRHISRRCQTRLPWHKKH